MPIVLFISNISSILQCNRVWVNRTVKEMVQRCIIHSGCPYKDGIDIIVAKIVTAQTADLVTFTEEILNGKLRFLCSVCSVTLWFIWVMAPIDDRRNDLGVIHRRANLKKFIKIYQLLSRKFFGFFKHIEKIFHWNLN